MSSRDIRYNITADNSGFLRGMDGVENRLSAVSGVMKNVGKIMVGVGAVIETSIAGLAYAGMKYDQAVASTDYTMSKLDKTVQDSIKTGMKQAKSLGFTEKQYREAASSVALMYKRLGNTTEQQEKMTTKTVDLAASLAAFADETPDEAVNSLASALVGNFNAMDKYRISLSAAGIEQGDYVKSLGKTYAELTPLEKQTAIYNEIMRQGSDYMGLAQTEANQANSQFNYLKTTLSETAGQIGQTLIPILVPLFQKLVEITEKVRDWVKEHPKLTKFILILAAAIGIALIVVGGLLLFFGFLLGAIAAIIPVMGAFGITTWAAMAPILLTIGLIILAIVALIAIGVVLWAYWDEIMAWFKNIWEQFKGWASDAWNSLKDAVKAAVDWVMDKWNSFVGAIQKAWDTIKGIWNKLFGGGSNSTITVTDGTGGSGKINNNAAGGIVVGNSLLGRNRVGEAGHEAIVPLTPQGLKTFSEGTGMGQPMTVIFNGYQLDDNGTRRIMEKIEKLQKTSRRGQGLGYGYGGIY